MLDCFNKYDRFCTEKGRSYRVFKFNNGISSEINFDSGIYTCFMWSKGEPSYVFSIILEDILVEFDRLNQFPIKRFMD